MPKEIITMTRDLFDEMLEATRAKELNRVLSVVRDVMEDSPASVDVSVLQEVIDRLYG
jgi:hypothetical protein